MHRTLFSGTLGLSMQYILNIKFRRVHVMVVWRRPRLTILYNSKFLCAGNLREFYEYSEIIKIFQSRNWQIHQNAKFSHFTVFQV